MVAPPSVEMHQKKEEKSSTEAVEKSKGLKEEQISATIFLVDLQNRQKSLAKEQEKATTLQNDLLTQTTQLQQDVSQAPPAPLQDRIVSLDHLKTHAEGLAAQLNSATFLLQSLQARATNHSNELTRILTSLDEIRAQGLGEEYRGRVQNLDRDLARGILLTDDLRKLEGHIDREHGSTNPGSV